jgi:hypothetical protein
MTMSIVASITAAALLLQPAAAPAPSAAPAPAPATAPATAAPATAAPATATPPASAPASGWDDDPVPPAPVVAPATVPPQTDQAPPPPQRKPKDHLGSALIGTGGGLLGLGLASWLLVAVPAAAVKSVALDRARREPVFSVETREDRYRRARHADNIMEGAFWFGVGSIAAGITLLVVGAVVKTRFKRRAAGLARIGGTPSGLSIRF